MKENNIEIKKFLIQNTDSKNADFSKRLISTQYEIYGTKLPVLKKFAKNLKPENIELYNNISHEEILLYSFSSLQSKNEEEQLKYLSNILPFIDNWCTCDCTVQSMKKLNGEESYNFFMKLLKNKKQFYARVGIIGLMRYFIKSSHISEILENFTQITNSEYYVKMALAWFYAELCVFNIDLAKIEISSITDKFIRNKSISKARESYRVSEENKAYLNSLKIK